MTSVYIVTEEHVETRGHGESGKIKKLSTYGGYDERQYPAFKSKEDAQRFIDEVSGYRKPQITELPIWEDVVLPPMTLSEIKYVGQGLLRTWKQEKELETSTSKVAPLMYYLRFNYEERHVKLCRRLGVEPCSFGAWLRKPISSII